MLVCLLIRAARGRGAIAAAACGLLWVFTALTVNSVRNCLAGHYPNLFGGNLLRRFSGPELAVALIVAAALFLLVVKSFLASSVAIARHALIAISVCGIVNVGLAVYRVGRTSQFPPLAPVRASFLPTQPGTTPRVVWLVFDELDYRLLFVDRKQGVSLPVLDDFRQTAIFASNAYPPSSATSTSLLTYLLGKRVVDVHPNGMDDLVLRTAGQPPRGQRHWRDLPNVFSRAREAGVNGAVVGWYLPYPRLLGSVTVDSWWFDNRTSDAATGDRLWDMLLNNPRTLIETSLLSPFGQSLLTKRRVRMFHEFMAKTHELLNDDRVGLLLLHVPVPHTPYFYDRQSGQNSLSNSTIDGYWDALALVDRIVGEVRTQMMQLGEWDNSVVLVSSDHYYRTAVRLDGHVDHRVPFLLKMPGQRRALSFETPFNTQLSHNLVLDILRRQVRTDASAMNWLEESHSTIPVGWGVR